MRGGTAARAGVALTLDVAGHARAPGLEVAHHGLQQRVDGVVLAVAHGGKQGKGSGHAGVLVFLVPASLGPVPFLPGAAAASPAAWQWPQPRSRSLPSPRP